MIKVYDSKEIEEKIIKKMYKILIENQYITYSDYEDNPEWYYKWVEMMRTQPDYHIIASYKNNKLVGFLNYCKDGEDNWISEVQIDDKYKRTGITKNLLKKYYEIMKKDNVIIIRGHINSKNLLSQTVFRDHVGFKLIDGMKTQYLLSIDDLKKYIDKI